MNIFLNTIDAYKKLHTYRNSLISTEDPGITPGTTEALKYLVFDQVCNTQPQQMIKKGTSKKEKPGSGWRRIEGKDIWFESVWHANYARALEVWANIGKFKKWEYMPKRFYMEGYGHYTPTFRVTDWDGKYIWIEINGHDYDIDLKAIMFGCYFPDELFDRVDIKYFTEREEFFKKVIPEWEN